LKALPEISGVKMHVGLDPDEAQELGKQLKTFTKTYKKLLKPKRKTNHIKQLRQKLQALLDASPDNASVESVEVKPSSRKKQASSNLVDRVVSKYYKF
jgi:hypothetical protein